MDESEAPVHVHLFYLCAVRFIGCPPADRFVKITFVYMYVLPTLQIVRSLKLFMCIECFPPVLFPIGFVLLQGLVPEISYLKVGSRCPANRENFDFEPATEGVCSRDGTAYLRQEGDLGQEGDLEKNIPHPQITQLPTPV